MTHKQCRVCECVRERMGVKSQGHICQRACTTTKCQLILLNDWQLPACGYGGRQRIDAAGSEPPSYGPPLNIGHKKQPWISSGPGLTIGWMIHHLTMKLRVWCTSWATQMGLSNTRFIQTVTLYCHALCFWLPQLCSSFLENEIGAICTTTSWNRLKDAFKLEENTYSTEAWFEHRLT